MFISVFKKIINKKQIVLLIIVLLFLLFPLFQTSAQSNSSSAIIDLRCQREQLLKPHVVTPAPTQLFRGILKDVPPSSSNFYARDCCMEGNSESEIECLEFLYPSTSEEHGLFGKWGFNILQTDVIFNKENLPGMVRLVISVVFAIFGLVKFVNLFLAMDLWIRSVWLEGNKIDSKKVKVYFTNGMIGTLFSAGAIIITMLVFRVIGYDKGVFEFDTDINRLLDVSCESYENEKLCSKYDLSCQYDSFWAACDEIIRSSTGDKCKNNKYYHPVSFTDTQIRFCREDERTGEMPEKCIYITECKPKDTVELTEDFCNDVISDKKKGEECYEN